MTKKEAKALVFNIQAKDIELQKTAAFIETQKKQVIRATDPLFEKAVKTTLEEMSIEKLNASKQGIRIAALEKAGKEHTLITYEDDVHGLHHPEDVPIILDWLL